MGGGRTEGGGNDEAAATDSPSVMPRWERVREVQPGGPLAPVHLPLFTPRMLLRTARPGDARALATVLNDRAVSRPTLRMPYPYTLEHARRFVTRNPVQVSSGEALSLLAFAREGGELLGGTALREFDWRDRRAILGYWIARRHWGKGLATESVEAVCRAGFRQLRLHRIEAKVFSFNPASARVLSHVGFRLEGTRRQAARKGARWVDSQIYGLLASEFHASGRVSGREGFPHQVEIEPCTGPRRDPPTS